MDASQGSGRAEEQLKESRRRRGTGGEISTTGDFVLTSLRSPSLAGAVGRQIQGRLGGSHGPDGAFTGAFLCFFGCQWDAGRASRFGPADEIYENSRDFRFFSSEEAAGE